MTLAVVILSGCSGGEPTSLPSSLSNTAASTSAPPAASATSAGPDVGVCHSKSLAMMTAALLRDGNLDSLPKLPDRSLGIPECKGLTTAQLDSIATQLQGELAPLLLAAAASQAGKTSTGTP